MSNYMRLADAATEFNLCSATIRRYTKDGRVNFYKDNTKKGCPIYVDVDDLNKVVKHPISPTLHIDKGAAPNPEIVPDFDPVPTNQDFKQLMNEIRELKEIMINVLQTLDNQRILSSPWIGPNTTPKQKVSTGNGMYKKGNRNY